MFLSFLALTGLKVTVVSQAIGTQEFYFDERCSDGRAIPESFAKIMKHTELGSGCTCVEHYEQGNTNMYKWCRLSSCSEPLVLSRDSCTDSKCEKCTAMATGHFQVPLNAFHHMPEERCVPVQWTPAKICSNEEKDIFPCVVKTYVKETGAAADYILAMGCDTNGKAEDAVLEFHGTPGPQYAPKDGPYLLKVALFVDDGCKYEVPGSAFHLFDATIPGTAITITDSSYSNHPTLMEDHCSCVHTRVPGHSVEIVEFLKFCLKSECDEAPAVVEQQSCVDEKCTTCSYRGSASTEFSWVDRGEGFIDSEGQWNKKVDTGCYKQTWTDPRLCPWKTPCPGYTRDNGDQKILVEMLGCGSFLTPITDDVGPPDTVSKSVVGKPTRIFAIFAFLWCLLGLSEKLS